jgi:putative nucleotidyltransferase with HDIG domain
MAIGRESPHRKAIKIPDIYTKDSSVSTAAAPLIAGTLLFGVTGALVLSLVISLTATIKKRNSLIRLIFNTSNHFISSSLSTLVFLVSQNSFTSFPVYIQLFISLGAGVVVYFSSTLVLSGVLHLTKGQNFKSLWMEHFSWLLPYYAAFGLVSFALILGYTSAGFLGVAATMVPLLIIRLSQYQYIENTKSLVNQLHSTNTVLEDNNQTISMINEDLLMSLANTIDLRDSYTMGHSKHVANIVTTIAKELGLPAEKVEMIRKSALLHDIGKIGIPDSILFKPGDLTYEEFEIIKQHPVRGAEILEVNTSLRELGPIIRHHHEHYDGSGYPDGLRGVEIPYEARILTLADSVQAMLSSRPYRNGLEIQEVISEVRENVSSQFDPEIARVFLYIMENDPAAFNLPFSLVQSGSSFKRKESA